MNRITFLSFVPRTRGKRLSDSTKWLESRTKRMFRQYPFGFCRCGHHQNYWDDRPRLFSFFPLFFGEGIEESIKFLNEKRKKKRKRGKREKKKRKKRKKKRKKKKRKTKNNVLVLKIKMRFNTSKSNNTLKKIILNNFIVLNL